MDDGFPGQSDLRLIRLLLVEDLPVTVDETVIDRLEEHCRLHLFKSPTVDMGNRDGAQKFGYEVVKETAKLDDGSQAEKPEQEKK